MSDDKHVITWDLLEVERCVDEMIQMFENDILSQKLQVYHKVLAKKRKTKNKQE